MLCRDLSDLRPCFIYESMSDYARYQLSLQIDLPHVCSSLMLWIMYFSRMRRSKLIAGKWGTQCRQMWKQSPENEETNYQKMRKQISGKWRKFPGKLIAWKRGILITGKWVNWSPVRGGKLKIAGKLGNLPPEKGETNQWSPENEKPIAGKWRN